MRNRGLRAGWLLASSAIACAANAGETITYDYDALGRLIRVEHGGTVNSGTSAAYSYDPADNRTNVTVTVAGAPAPPPASPVPPPPPASIPLELLDAASGSQLQCATATNDVTAGDAGGVCPQAAPAPDDPPPAPPSDEEPG